MAGTIKLEGMADLEKKFQRMERGLAEKTLRSAVAAGAGVIRKEARNNLSAVAGSVSAKTQKDVVVKRGKRGNGFIEYSIGARTRRFYLSFLEFGTLPHIIKASKLKRFLRIGNTFVGGTVEHPGQPARPWLRPAFDNSGAAVMARIKKRMQAGLAKYAAGRDDSVDGDP
jgi:HK97 gp10 family phage protein